MPSSFDRMWQSYTTQWGLLHSLTGPIAKLDGKDYYYINNEIMDFETWNTHPEVVKYRNELKLREALGLSGDKLPPKE